MALLAVPWTIKPVFGLLSDFVPLFGSRRRNYLLLSNGRGGELASAGIRPARARKSLATVRASAPDHDGLIALGGSRRWGYAHHTDLPKVAGTINFAGSASEAFGGWLFEATKLQGRDAFGIVVAISVAFAASCWLLVPLLRRAAPQWWD